MLSDDDLEKLKKSLTEEHVELLRLMSNPREWFKQNNKPLPNTGGRSLVMNDIENLVLEAFPKYKTNKNRIREIFQDFWSFDLVQKTELDVMMTGEGALQSRTTGRGNEFLKCISKNL
jgi:hypothetical protein